LEKHDLALVWDPAGWFRRTHRNRSSRRKSPTTEKE
jgi:hypothetical protein